jgi:anti-sigma B factor antagonist
VSLALADILTQVRRNAKGRTLNLKAAGCTLLPGQNLKTEIPAQSRVQKGNAMLNIQKKQVEPDVTVVEISGRLSIGRACQEVEWQLKDLLKEQRTKIVFDLTDLQYIDSTGIGIIVMCYGKLKNAGGDLRVACPQGVVDDTIKLTRVNQIIQLYPTCTAATESFLAPPSTEIPS